MGSEADAPEDISVKRAPDVFQMSSPDGYTAHCDPWGRGRAAGRVIVLAKHADMAIEAAPAAVAGRNDIAGAKVGQ
jgi:hypothetical protein